MSAAYPAGIAFNAQAGWRYGLMGFPLAFVALPLYVQLPHFYALQFGVPLATLGTVLLLARLFDALIDPALGRWSDRSFAQSNAVALRRGLLAAAGLGLGFTLLFFPPHLSQSLLPVWAGLCLLLTYSAYSALAILHQSWGALLGGDEAQRARVVAWREGLGLLGVITASLAPLVLGMPATTSLFFLALVLGWWAWRSAPQPAASARTGTAASAHRIGGTVWLPWSRPPFRALLAVFMVNGIASAVPATLILFFVQDRLLASPTMQPFFLGSYFLSAALAIPVWLRLVRLIGLARTWGWGMLLAVLTFAFAAQLGAGDALAFLLVCTLSGVALGTDLAIPAAMLAGTIATCGDGGQAEGAYFGWWNFATKLNLALAAGVALPALEALGYTPGAQDPAALRALTWAYCVLPCALKLLAALLLYTQLIRKTP